LFDYLEEKINLNFSKIENFLENFDFSIKHQIYSNIKNYPKFIDLNNILRSYLLNESEECLNKIISKILIIVREARSKKLILFCFKCIVFFRNINRNIWIEFVRIFKHLLCFVYCVFYVRPEIRNVIRCLAAFFTNDKFKFRKAYEIPEIHQYPMKNKCRNIDLFTYNMIDFLEQQGALLYIFSRLTELRYASILSNKTLITELSDGSVNQLSFSLCLHDVKSLMRIISSSCLVLTDENLSNIVYKNDEIGINLLLLTYVIYYFSC
jgi:hypothetical protein